MKQSDAGGVTGFSSPRWPSRSRRSQVNLRSCSPSLRSRGMPKPSQYIVLPFRTSLHIRLRPSSDQSDGIRSTTAEIRTLGGPKLLSYRWRIISSKSRPMALNQPYPTSYAFRMFNIPLPNSPARGHRCSLAHFSQNSVVISFGTRRWRGRSSFTSLLSLGRDGAARTHSRMVVRLRTKRYSINWFSEPSALRVVTSIILRRLWRISE